MRECVDEGMLQSYFDGELSSRMAESVSSHLASCAGCAQAASELEGESLLLAEALGAEFAVSVPSERLRERVDAAIAEVRLNSGRAGVASNAAGTPAVSVIQHWLQSIAELFTPQRALGYAGLAAVVLLASVIGGVYWRQATSTNDRAANAANGWSAIAHDPLAVPQITPTPGPLAVNAPTKKRLLVNPNPPSESAHVKLLPGERSYLKTIASLDAAIKAESNRQMKPSMQVEYERNLAMVDQAIAATRSAAKVNPSDPDAAEFMFSAYQSKIDLLSQVADSRLAANRSHK